ncbi:hypothetical protein FRC17_000641 [Serendipita sp. 399]|nr:hypothetical protein FRC17_000641 [Serendipita sp. 399]
MITADSPSDGGDDLEQSTEIQRLLQDQLDAEGDAALQAALTQSLVDNATVVDSSLQRADSNDNLIPDTDVELQAALLRSTAPDSGLEDEDLALQFALLYSTDPTYAEMDIEMQTTLMDSAQPVSPAGEVAATAQTELDLASGSLSDDVQMTSNLNHDRSPVAVAVNSPSPGEDLDHRRDPSPALEPLPEIDSNTAPEVNSAGSRPTSPAYSSVMPVALSQYGLVDRAEQMRRRILDANSDVASVIPFFDGGYHNPDISPPFAPWTILAPFLSKKFDIERGRGAETPTANRANAI